MQFELFSYIVCHLDSDILQKHVYIKFDSICVSMSLLIGFIVKAKQLADKHRNTIWKNI